VHLTRDNGDVPIAEPMVTPMAGDDSHVATVGQVTKLRRAAPAAPVRRMTVRGLLGRFLIAGLLSTSVVVAITAFISRRTGINEANRQARQTTLIIGGGLIEPALTTGVMAGNVDDLERLNSLVRRIVINDSLVRVKLWRPDGVIVYADDSRLIGANFTLDEDELDVLRTGKSHSAISDLSKPENGFERPDRQLVEVYARVFGPSGEPLLFEAYYAKATVDEAGRQAWARYAPISLVAVIALQLAQIPIVWQLARRLSHQQAERESLLRKALEATDIERRRIAGDIHDGVVQDLSGVSFSLSAAARSSTLAPEVARPISEAAERVRIAVQGLRSLLVDIYPRNLSDDGLEVALGDLVARLSGHGLKAELSVDLPAEPDEELTTVVYRSAQEAVRNVTKHARASSVSLDVRALDDCIVLTVEDDGVGFDPTTIGARREKGHVGMHVLADVVNRYGGTVNVESAPGKGTRVIVEVPK
jgi:two-component system, NarL family, sensor kinase